MWPAMRARARGTGSGLGQQMAEVRWRPCQEHFLDMIVLLGMGGHNRQL